MDDKQTNLLQERYEGHEMKCHIFLYYRQWSLHQSFSIFQSNLTMDGIFPGTHKDEEAPKTIREIQIKKKKKKKSLDHKLMPLSNFSHNH